MFCEQVTNMISQFVHKALFCLYKYSNNFISIVYMFHCRKIHNVTIKKNYTNQLRIDWILSSDHNRQGLIGQNLYQPIRLAKVSKPRHFEQQKDAVVRWEDKFVSINFENVKELTRKPIKDHHIEGEFIIATFGKARISDGTYVCQ